MFEVRYTQALATQGADGSETFTVYAVSEEATDIYFLMYEPGRGGWVWNAASNYIPAE